VSYGWAILTLWILLGILVGFDTARREGRAAPGVVWGVVTALFGVVALAVWLVWLLVTGRRRGRIAGPTY
jgi:hypothetical protein